MIVNVVLWAVGVAMVAAGAVMVRGPLARYRELVEREANLRRYDEWRGSRLIDDGSRTGADEMKAQLKSRVWLWGGAIVAGVVLIVAGFVVR